MKRKKFTRSAATSVAGNIVVSWLALNVSPRDISKLNRFAQELDFALRVKFPTGTLGRSMPGTESEIRQNAAILLLDKYLAGNRELTAATATANIAEIANQLDRSIAAALKVCHLQLRERRKKEAEKLEKILDEYPRLPYVLPASSTRLWQLPNALKHVLALKLLQISVQRRQASKASAKIVRALLLDETMTQADMARKLAVSPSAISQTVHSVAKKIRTLAKEIDFPQS